MTDTAFPNIDEQGCLHISIAQQKDLLRSMGGLKASEHRLLLANGIKLSEADPFAATMALGTIFMRRRQPTLSFEEVENLVMLDFVNGDGELVDLDDDAADVGAVAEPDPPIAGS